MKRVGYLMEQIASRENLYLAYSKAQRGKQGKSDVQEFGRLVEENIDRLRYQLTNESWQIGDYHYFRIYDPKERLICAASFPERVLHHAIMNVCHSYFDKQLISDTYASRVGKGTYAAIDKAREGSRRHAYVAKLDVRKYFDSIDHAVLKIQLRRLFKDGTLLHLLDDIIDSYETTSGRGLPIGNLTSQYFANCYLSWLDHFVKEQLHVPIYVRYMDDMLVFGNSKVEVQHYVSSIIEQMEELQLCVKPPLLLQTEQGVPFLGYRIYPQKVLLCGRSKRRFLHKYMLLHQLLDNETISEREYLKRVLPLLAYVRKGYTKRYRLTVMDRTA